MAAGIAVVATVLGRAVPLLGAPVVGVVVGVALSRRIGRRTGVRPGLAWASTYVLQAAVVVLGCQLSLRQVLRVGAASLPVMLATLTVCLALAFALGRRLGIGRDLRTLIGVGTGICGASAIAAVSPTIRARGDHIAYAMSTIFLFNVAAVLVFPPLGHLLRLSQHAFGLFAGTAVNDTSSVVAAASSYGTAASHYAVVVKLARTLMIIPISFALAALTRRRDPATDGAGQPLRHAARLVPWFLLGFLALASINSAGLVPAAVRPPAQAVSLFLITVALTAIGLSTDIAGLRRAGLRPLLLGLLLWIAVAATSLTLQGVAA